MVNIFSDALKRFSAQSHMKLMFFTVSQETDQLIHSLHRYRRYVGAVVQTCLDVHFKYEQFSLSICLSPFPPSFQISCYLAPQSKDCVCLSKSLVNHIVALFPQPQITEPCKTIKRMRKSSLFENPLRNTYIVLCFSHWYSLQPVHKFNSNGGNCCIFSWEIAGKAVYEPV